MTHRLLLLRHGEVLPPRRCGRHRPRAGQRRAGRSAPGHHRRPHPRAHRRDAPDPPDRRRHRHRGQSGRRHRRRAPGRVRAAQPRPLRRRRAGQHGQQRGRPRRAGAWHDRGRSSCRAVLREVLQSAGPYRLVAAADVPGDDAEALPAGSTTSPPASPTGPPSRPVSPSGSRIRPCCAPVHWRTSATTPASPNGSPVLNCPSPPTAPSPFAGTSAPIEGRSSAPGTPCSTPTASPCACLAPASNPWRATPSLATSRSSWVQ